MLKLQSTRPADLSTQTWADPALYLVRHYRIVYLDGRIEHLTVNEPVHREGEHAEFAVIAVQHRDRRTAYPQHNRQLVLSVHMSTVKEIREVEPYQLTVWQWLRSPLRVGWARRG